jgi:hypothetical protein
MTMRDELRRRERLVRHLWWFGGALFVISLLVSAMRDLGLFPPLLIAGVFVGLFCYTARFRCPRCGWRIGLQSRVSGHPQSIQHIAQECSSCGLPFDTELDVTRKA